MSSAAPTRRTRKKGGDRSGGGADAGGWWRCLVRGRDDAARVPALARGLGATRRAGDGDDQRTEQPTGAPRGDQYRHGGDGAGGAGAESGGGQRGIARGVGDADGGGEEFAGLGQRAAAPHPRGAGDGGGDGDRGAAAAVPLAGVDAVRGRMARDETGGGGESGIRGRGRVGTARGGLAGRTLTR